MIEFIAILTSLFWMVIKFLGIALVVVLVAIVFVLWLASRIIIIVDSGITDNE